MSDAIVHGPIKQKGKTLRSGAPFRSIRESMVSRTPGMRAALRYSTPLPDIDSDRRQSPPRPSGGKYLRNKAATQGLAQVGRKALGSTIGRVAGRVARGIFAGGTAVGLATEALDLGANVMALERAKREERDAKMGTAMIRSAMKERRKPKVVKMD